MSNNVITIIVIIELIHEYKNTQTQKLKNLFGLLHQLKATEEVFSRGLEL